jgi:hypothetical protein
MIKRSGRASTAATRKNSREKSKREYNKAQMTASHEKSLTNARRSRRWTL